MYLHVRIYNYCLPLLLYQHGFMLIDGLDPSKGMLDVPEKKEKYQKLYWEFFTPEPTSLKESK